MQPLGTEFDIMMNYYKYVEYLRYIGTYFSDSVQLMYCIECTMGLIT